MDRARVQPTQMHRLVFGAAIVAVVAAMALLTRVAMSPSTECPSDSAEVSRIQLAGTTADVALEGKPYRLSANAFLEHGGTAGPSAYRSSDADHYELAVNATISAPSREALDQPEFTCFLAVQDSDVWSRRPMTYPTQTMADGNPPGAPAPSPNEAWRRASVRNGPTWRAGSMIDLELWITVRSRHYVVTVPSVMLVKTP